MQAPSTAQCTHGSNIHPLVCTFVLALTEGGPCNQYWLGRGKTCDIRVDDARVSSQHCFILCEEVREAGRVVLKAFIEDNSSNGTFINGDVKLRKVSRNTSRIM